MSEKISLDSSDSEFNFSILIMNIITFVILKCVLYKSIKIVI